MGLANLVLCICNWCCSLFYDSTLLRGLVTFLTIRLLAISDFCTNHMKPFSLFLLFLLSLSTAWAQCPMCKASVESSQSAGVKSVGMGLNVGILILLASVYVILFSVGILWYKKYRKSH